MKKLRILLLVLAVSLGSSSCIVVMRGPVRPYGRGHHYGHSHHHHHHWHHSVPGRRHW